MARAIPSQTATGPYRMTRLAEVTAAGKVAAGGGLIEENEDIVTVSWSPAELAEAVAQGQIQDAKTLIGILWFQARNSKQ